MLFFVGLAAVFTAMLMIPGSVQRFALIHSYIAEGAYYRLLTYQFVHLGVYHLLQNIAGLLLICLIASELRKDDNEFFLVYFLSGLAAAIPLWLLTRSSILGASVAIYGAFGMHTVDVGRLSIKQWHVLLAIVALAIFQPMAELIAGMDFVGSLEQAMLHISGLVFGYSAYLMIKLIRPFLERKRLRCLRSCDES